MIEHVLPAAVVTECAHTDDGHPGEGLFPQERELVARAVDTRVREFTTVRTLARRALGRLGRSPAPILPNPRGAPQWPDGVVGSMTHCTGYRAAAVSPAAESAAVSIDAEPDAPLPAGVLEAVTLPDERAAIRVLARRSPGVAWDRMYFSAKESVFKAWYPLTGRELDFDEAEIAFDAGAGTFSARLLVPGPTIGGQRVTVFPGRWRTGRGLLVTGVHLAAPAADSGVFPAGPVLG